MYLGLYSRYYFSAFIVLNFKTLTYGTTDEFADKSAINCEIIECGSLHIETCALKCRHGFFLISTSLSLKCSENGKLLMTDGQNITTICSKHCPEGYGEFVNGTANVCLQCNDTFSCKNSILKSARYINGSTSDHVSNESTKATIALVIGCLTFVIVICAIIFYLYRRTRKRKQRRARHKENDVSVEVDTDKDDNVDKNFDILNKRNGSKASSNRYVADPTVKLNNKNKNNEAYDYVTERVITREHYKVTDGLQEDIYEEYEDRSFNSNEEVEDGIYVNHAFEKEEEKNTVIVGHDSTLTRVNIYNQGGNIIPVKCNNVNVNCQYIQQLTACNNININVSIQEKMSSDKEQNGAKKNKTL